MRGMALAASLDHLGEHFDNAAARLLGETLDEATGQLLLNRKAPSRKVNELDNRGSHYYLATYWAQHLAKSSDEAIAAQFGPIAEALAANEETIVAELNEVQGAAVDIGGYYLPDEERVAAIMRPSATLNGIIDGI